MPEVLTCPSCQRKLQVPEDLLGQDVQCPTCGATFLARVGAAASTAGSRNNESPSRALQKSSRRERDPEPEDFPDYDGGARRSKVRRRRRSDYEPHRGPMIMTMGIVSIFFMPLILGPIAWIMGNNDLAAIRAGRMDPEGESQTNTGKICGMVGTILGIVQLVIGIVFLCLWLSCLGAAIGGGAGGGGGPRRM